MTNELIISDKKEPTEDEQSLVASSEQDKSIVWEVLKKLELSWVDSDRIAKTLDKLLDAKTLNWRWDEMADNKVILDTLKLVFKLHWVKITDNNINIAILQAPPKDSKLQF